MTKLGSHARWSESGHIALTGKFWRLFQAIDRLLLKLGALVLAKEHYFPALISANELKKVDYFRHFPHLIHFAVNLKLKDESLRNFANSEVVNARGEVTLGDIAPISDCLAPAACFHLFTFYQNQNFSKPALLTTRSHCFRQENFYQPLQRQREFNMREIVCIGSLEHVQQFLNSFQEAISHLFTQLDLPIIWKKASDSFFGPVNSPQSHNTTLKSEMIYKKRNGQDISLGSLNLHETFFSEAFNIKFNDQSAHSACIAFGLERWIYSFCEEFGEDESNWPNLDNVFLREIPQLSDLA